MLGASYWRAAATLRAGIRVAPYGLVFEANMFGTQLPGRSDGATRHDAIVIAVVPNDLVDRADHRLPRGDVARNTERKVGALSPVTRREPYIAADRERSSNLMSQLPRWNDSPTVNCAPIGTTYNVTNRTSGLTATCPVTRWCSPKPNSPNMPLSAA